MYLLVAFLGKGGACGTEMAGFSAAKAEFLFDAAFAFFWSKFGDLDRVYDHGVRVVGLGVGRVREGVVGLMGRPRVSLGDVIGAFPLSLESDGLLVPFVDGRRDGVHGHDAAHERGWDSCREVSDQDIGIGDIGKGDVVFECGNIFHQGGGVRVILLLLHSLGRKPGDGVPGDVVVLERSVELRDEVSKSSEGERCSRDGALAEGHCPGKSRPFSHIREGESDLFVIIVVHRFVDKKIELHGVQPVLGFFVGAIERFGGADA